MKKLAAFMSVIALLSAVSCSPDVEISETQESVTEEIETENTKTVLTVGTMGYIDPLFSDHLNMPQDIEIKFVNFTAGITPDYSTKQKENAYNDAVELALDMAVISGETPDILCLPAENMQKMINHGVMTDMYKLMDEYDNLKRDDFTECSLEGLTVDGELPAIMERYIIWTAFAKSKFVGKEFENWTASEAMDFYVKMPEFDEDMEFSRFDRETGLVDYMLKREGMNCIDMKNNTCDFGDAFVELLDFCKNNPIEYNTYETLGYESFNDLELVHTLRISGLNSSLAQNAYFYAGEEDITFVGYPSEDGQGTYVEPWHMTLFGITEHCENKEAAWDIICGMLKHHQKLEKYQTDDTIGVPTLKEEMQRDYDRNKSYNNSINTEIWTEDGKEQKYLPSEIKEMFYQYILSVPANPYIPQKLKYMIEEETEPVIMGEKTAENAAEILQNRISIYLSEKS